MNKDPFFSFDKQSSFRCSLGGDSAIEAELAEKIYHSFQLTLTITKAKKKKRRKENENYESRELRAEPGLLLLLIVAFACS